MNIVLFYLSLASDWNHGNAHFLRGTVKELLKRGHDVKVYESEENWSISNLKEDHGKEKAREYHQYYPTLKTFSYDAEHPDYEEMLKDADLVIVHEWNRHDFVKAVGENKSAYGYKLLFHDTHHRAVSDPESMSAYDFGKYDGALVFGEVIKNIYQENNWMDKVWTWHEAADEKLFSPKPEVEKEGHLVWIGNWGDNGHTEELMEYLINPVKKLGLVATVYGVRYPQKALVALREAGIQYGGYLPNYKVPEVFARYKVTVHVPRRHYVNLLPGIPTIRPFEAMSCGIPLICSPWKDKENLFIEGEDYLIAKDEEGMVEQLKKVLVDKELADNLSKNGRERILNNHTCAHRVNELEEIFNQMGIDKDLISPLQTNSLEYEQ